MRYLGQVGAWMMLIIGLTGLGQPPALAADPVPAGAIPGLAELIRQRDWVRAVQIIDRALEQDPGHLPAIYWKSFVLFQAGNYRQSGALAEQYLKRNPSSGEAHKILGLACFMLGQAALAESELQKASELAAADSDVRYYLGRIQFERHNLPAALESFRGVVVLDSQSVRGFNHLGQTYEGLARFDDARAAYEKAIELDRRQSRRSEWPYFNLGVLLLKEGRAPDAVGWLRQALALKPSWPEARIQLAVALGSANQYTDARQLLEDLLLAEPGNAQAHYQLARLLVKMQLPDQARRHFLLFAESKQP